MKEKNDNVYIYLWEDLNTIYIGRTKNPKVRHWAHKNRNTEKTYKFSMEHGVEHPKMIIIENNLSTKNGAEREKYWIKYYREKTTYFVLNKTCGGQIGRKSVYSKEEIKQHKKEYYENNKEKFKNVNKKNYEKYKNDSNYKNTRNIRSLEYRKKHAKEIKEYQKKYYAEKNIQKKILKVQNEISKKILKIEKEIIKKNSENRRKNKLKLYQKMYREKHKNEMKNYQKKYYNDNKDKLKEYYRNYYKSKAVEK